MSRSKQQGSTRQRSGQGQRGGAQGEGTREVRGGVAQKVQPDEQLAAIVGKEPLTRAELTKRIWDYIKSNDLQDTEDRRQILADDRLRPIFGKDRVSMFEMTKLVNMHVR
ncbi:SWIB/MDM2 domain-containing protein [Calidithermus chliarophilus]|uniref:SWIB/MDM2 domain-containing protein n=1 Tax=Calidithermus chliarophilus TaxID=52023 RepID=UPI0004129802|nr:SWIB/MDM2 domain-containing protein [Calidithermus chliarophilus]